MTSLLNQLEESLPNLRHKLNEAKSIQAVVNVLQNEVNSYAHISSDYMGSLTKPQFKVASTMLDALSKSINILNAIDIHLDFSGKSSNTKKTFNPSSGEIAAITGATIGGILSKLSLLPTISAAGFVLLAKLIEGYRSDIGEETVNTSTRLLFRVDPDVLVEYLADEYRKIDEAVDAVKISAEINESHEVSLEDMPEILDFLHDLIGDATEESNQLPVFTSKHIQNLPKILRLYHIDIEHYSPDLSERRTQEMFDFEHDPNSSLTSPKEIRPAFLKDDEVVRRGLVIRS